MQKDFTGRTELDALIDYESALQQELEHVRAKPVAGRAVNMVAILQSDLDVCAAEIRRLRLHALLQYNPLGKGNTQVAP